MNKKTPTIKNRIVELIKKQGFKVSKFFPEIDESYENYKGRSLNSSPGADILGKILTKIPRANIKWLLTGEGEMLITETTHDDKLFEYLKEQGREKDKKIEALLIENTQLKMEIERLKLTSPASSYQNVD